VSNFGFADRQGVPNKRLGFWTVGFDTTKSCHGDFAMQTAEKLSITLPGEMVRIIREAMRGWMERGTPSGDIARRH
jgi:hypothetical protein